MIAAADGNEWLTYGRDYGEQRFSPLTQISDANVARARPRLVRRPRHRARAGSDAADARRRALRLDRVEHGQGVRRRAPASSSGPTIPKVPRETLAVACCDAVNRGVALYGDKVYVATLDGYLVALNQSDGKVAWRKEVVPDHDSYTITGAPRVAKGKVLHRLGRRGIPRARLHRRVRLGDRRGSCGASTPCPAIPRTAFENAAMERAAATWGGEWWELGGGGTVWDSITYDPAHQPRAVRHRQRRAVEPGRQRARQGRRRGGLGRQSLHLARSSR